MLDISHSNKGSFIEPRNKERFVLEDNELARNLFGERGAHLKIIERELNLGIHNRGNEVTLEGDPADVGLGKKVLNQLAHIISKGYPIYPDDVEFAVNILSGDENANLTDIFLDQVFISAKRRIITPKTLNQKNYIDAIRKNDIVFGIGPAGTGKTYLAMAMAVDSLVKGEKNRIILARPAVEAGEKLGFLPGDLYEKVNPYLRPLYDALHDMMDFSKASHMLQQGAIEVAPLAFMRGRTLNNAFVILDEAQNSTTEQMKMFLTRLGFGSRAIITGDITQIDLPTGTSSGLIEAKDILSGIKGISFVYFEKRDVVRHRLVKEIIRAYEELDARKAGENR